MTAVRSAQIAGFLSRCEHVAGRTFTDHEDLYRWSVEQFREFWRELLDWSGIDYSGDAGMVCRGDDVETARFFPDLRLNYVEHLLRPIDDATSSIDSEAGPAVIAHRAEGSVTRTTRAELRRQVIAAAAALQRRGVKAGDRVVAVSGNTDRLVVGALAALAIGATLSTAAPDMGVASVLARVEQLDPTVLLFGGADPAHTGALRDGLPTLRLVVALDDGELADPAFAGAHPLSTLTAEDPGAWAWPRLPFDHPLLILFSSGTTGPPKCIVHSAGGVLLEHVKELALHEDLRVGDTLFFHTSPAWMMWNWQLSALATGATIVVYDGRVATADALWSIVAAERVTAFGTGPSYLRFCRTAGYSPRTELDLSALRIVLSTGAVLRAEHYDWVGREVGDVAVHSISGGTDIVGCFVLGSPIVPVVSGESPTRSLGLDVRALDPDPQTGVGELVCATPFPSRPLGLLDDTTGARFHAAYFAQHPGVWTHGDRIEITARGSVRMHGRSDGMLNVGGVRIGPAEIYAVVNDLPGVADSLVVEQLVPDAVETSRLVLLVIMTEPDRLDDALRREIRQQLSRRTTAAHVPRVIVEVDDLPRTFSGKVSETAVRDALDSAPVRNLQALENPQSLQAIVAAVTQADTLQPHASTGVADSADPLVDTIRAIFADILGVPSVGPDDSFLELGGTSLALAATRHLLYERLGYDVALSAIFTAPRARALARFLTEEQGSDALVPLRAHGSGRPVFAIHDLTGDVLAYTHLVAALPLGRPVFGVRARALDARLEPDSTVEQMTASALASVRAAQPHGPYTLLGYSFGGMLAWQLAHRLRETGDTVDLVVLVDCYVNPQCLPIAERVWFRWATRPLELARRLITTPVATIRRAAEVLRGVHAPAVPVTADAALTPLAQAIERVTAAEIRRFRPADYDGDVVFVRAAERDPLQCEPVEVWQRATFGDFAVLRVPGGHNTALDAAHVGPFAERLGGLLARGAAHAD